MTDISENTSVKIRLVYVVPIVLSLISFGGIIDRLLTSEQRREELKNFLLDEVSGLRSDWERDKKSQEYRLNRLENE